MTSAGGARLERDDLPAVALLFAFAFAVHSITALVGARSAEIPLSTLGAYFDGHLYLRVARSFPLPYSPEGADYLGLAPGYPALVYLTRLLTPDAWVNWATAAILVSWICASLSAAAFYALCKATGTPPFWVSVLFVVGNPRWVAMAATPHPEALGMLLTILSLVAYFRGRLGWSAVALCAAVATRYPALALAATLAFAVLVLRREVGLRNLAVLAAPLATFGLIHLYLSLRAPGFSGVWAAHKVFWDVEMTWPFAAFLEHAGKWNRPFFWLTYSSLAACLLSTAVGFRPKERALWVLPIWIGALAVFHASLGGVMAVKGFPRFIVLAWPGVLLVLWRWIGLRLPAAVALLLCLAMTAYAPLRARFQIRGAVRMQTEGQPLLLEELRNLDSNQPRWSDVTRGPGRLRDPQERSPQEPPPHPRRGDPAAP